VTIVAKRPILAGEEITINYNYNLSVAPDWYKQYVANYKTENRSAA